MFEVRLWKRSSTGLYRIWQTRTLVKAATPIGALARFEAEYAPAHRDWFEPLNVAAVIDSEGSAIGLEIRPNGRYSTYPIDQGPYYRPMQPIGVAR